MLKTMNNTISLNYHEVFGEHYYEYLNFKGRYRVNKGSRGSKKSVNTAQSFILDIMNIPDSNLLVVRKVFRTMKDSVYTELKRAINKLGFSALWECKISPLEMTYRPTGQKILFRGLDDPLKITSITVEKGYLCLVWIEEAYEINNEEDFNMLDESIRGATPKHIYKQITLTFNPWNERHWLKKRFYDVEDKNILAITTNYMMNEFLDDADIKMYEDMKIRNPKRYKVAGLGDWGIVEGLIYENWIEKAFSKKDMEKCNIEYIYGMDFGYTNDPTALFCGAVDRDNMVIYVFDELYKTKLTNKMIYDKLRAMGYAKEKIVADNNEPKSIRELEEFGAWNIVGARKGKDSVNNGIQHIQNYKIIIHPRCVSFITEISNYTWGEDNKTGRKLNTPVDDMNHLMDAMRYAMEGYTRGKYFDLL